MSLNSADAIQSLVSPVVMVSADALLCLAFYNRLSAVFGRLRAIHKESVDLAAQMSSDSIDQLGRANHHWLHDRNLTLKNLSAQLVERAKWVRRALFFLLTAILFMLATSLTIGAANFYSEFGAWAPWLFATGTLATMAGIATALQELRLSLGPLTFEANHIGSDSIDKVLV